MSIHVCSRAGFLWVAGSAIFATIAMLWILALRDDLEIIPKLIQLPTETVFDYIIVGAGSSGCVLAHSLAIKSNFSVLLIEAGHRFGFLSDVPLLAPFLQSGQYDWRFVTTSQEYSSNGLYERRQFLARGKGLGGSAQINFMLSFPGHKADFDNWQAMGNANWSYDNLQPYFDTLENSGEDMWEVPADYSKLTESFEDARDEFPDLKFRRSQYNIKNGVRWSPFQKYLRPALKEANMHLLVNTLVEQVRFEGLAATSVVVSAASDRDEKYEIFAKREIILSAGAYQSPQLLMVSGVGPQRDLEAAQVPIVLASERVGKNLHDHVNLALFSSANHSCSLNADKLLTLKQVRDYFESGSGAFGTFGVLGHVDGSNGSYGIALFGVGSIDENHLMTISNFKRDNFRALFPRYYNASQEGFVLISNCYQPKSRGWVSISHPDMTAQPVINPNYLQDEYDVNCTIEATQMAAKIARSNSFSSLEPQVLWPRIAECLPDEGSEGFDGTNNPSHKYLDCVLRNVGLTSHHPGGTCSMGQDITNSVVDQDLKVHGVSRLRVMDASVLPTPISGNPQAVLVAMAKRVGDLILGGV